MIMTSRAKMPDVDKAQYLGITVGDTDGDTKAELRRDH
jgi:hypothetical protein